MAAQKEGAGEIRGSKKKKKKKVQHNAKKGLREGIVVDMKRNDHSILHV